MSHYRTKIDGAPDRPRPTGSGASGDIECRYLIRCSVYGKYRITPDIRSPANRLGTLMPGEAEAIFRLPRQRQIIRLHPGSCSQTPTCLAISTRFAPSSPFRKNNFLLGYPKSALEIRRLIPHEGRIASRHGRGVGCGGRSSVGVKRVRRAALP